jgi:hypothetical protein
MQSQEINMTTVTVHHGKHYEATVTLSGLEQLASNSTVAGRLTQLGFTDVAVTGSGKTRSASGLWNGADTTVEIDPHLSNIVEVA